MEDLQEIQNIIQRYKNHLREQYGVEEIGIFGSYVKGIQTSHSDLDLLVDFNRKMGLFEFVKLKNYLADLLGIKVDLVMKRALKPKIGEAILKEVQYV